MKLSVIIVNYNVRAYLEQCLRTVEKALEGIEGDVFVVDNLSNDGSVEMVRGKFPRVKLIANKENVGFSRANNQAIRASTADYVVLLNPDTVVGEDVFTKVIGFLDAHPKAGGLGVKMIDGTGHFLPESKRGLPTPAVAFFKIIGLTRLFPRSTVFGRYHLGHLPENEAAPIEILSGACMFLRKKTLDEVGLLDESFFMYGEDIDLSYRITLGGYENWYFPDARIIHYKGESTKKSSVNYVFVFYNAMAIFARKHFTRTGPDFFAWVIRASIYLSAAGAIAARFLRRMLLPMLDLAFTLTLSYFAYVTFIHDPPDRAAFFWGIARLTVAVQVVTALFGSYDRPVRLLNVGKGMLAAFIAGVAGRSFLSGVASRPWDLLMIAAWFTACFCAVRFVLHALRIRGYSLRDRERQHVLAIGSKVEAEEALALLWQTHFGLGWKGAMEPAEVGTDVSAITRLVRRQWVDEVVFCASDISWQRIIAWLEQLRHSGVEFKIAQPGRAFIIGPSSIESLHDLDVLERHAVNSAEGRRTKRVTDVLLSLSMLLAFPLALLVVADRSGFLRNWWQVFIGRRSWVGYAPTARSSRLPPVKSGVIDPVSALELEPLPLIVDRVNITYAKDYRAWQDLRLVWRGRARLGN